MDELISNNKIENKKKNKIKNLFDKEKIKNYIIDFVLIIFGFLVALGIFLVYMNNVKQKELNSLIPNAKSTYNSGNYSTAINLFLDAEKEFPNDIEIKEYLGKLYFAKGKYQESANYFEKVEKSQKLLSEEISQLGNSYIKINKNQELINLWKNTDLSPQNRFAFANIYLLNKDFDNYFAELSKIKTYKEPLFLLQVKETKLQTILENINIASNLPAISDSDLDFDLFKTQITEAKKQQDGGKKDYSELIQLIAFANISQCNFISPRISALRTSLETQKIPTYQIDFIDGKCANQSNNPDIAIPAINKAIVNDVSNIEYRQELAKSYFLKNDKDNLKSTFDDIFVIKKTSILIQNYAGYLYKLGDKQTALEQYKEAFKIAGTTSDKEDISKLIIQIEFLDFKSLDICKSNEIIDSLDPTLSEDYFLKSNCDIYNKNSISDSKFNGINIDYIQALSKKDKTEIERILDIDTEGYVTSYYNTIGLILMSN